jgi:hypothetical protein
MARIHTITITELNCGKYQVRTDCGLNEGHFEKLVDARRRAMKIVRTLENQRLLAKIEYVNVAH